MDSRAAGRGNGRAERQQGGRIFCRRSAAGLHVPTPKHRMRACGRLKLKMSSESAHSGPACCNQGCAVEPHAAAAHQGAQSASWLTRGRDQKGPGTTSQPTAYSKRRSAGPKGYVSGREACTGPACTMRQISCGGGREGPEGKTQDRRAVTTNVAPCQAEEAAPGRC